MHSAGGLKTLPQRRGGEGSTLFEEKQEIRNSFIAFLSFKIAQKITGCFKTKFLLSPSTFQIR